MMSRRKEPKLSFWAAHMTTVVSVTLVLVLSAIIGLGILWASEQGKRLRSNVELSLVMKDEIPDSTAQTLSAEIQQKEFAAKVRFISRAEATRIMSEELGDNIGELLGSEFLAPEIVVTLTPQYADKSKMKALSTRLETNPMVEKAVIADVEIVETMNHNIGRISWVLGVIAAIMTVISIVLIHNTVRLAIYSRRFTIHTMQLVGATSGFIMRPYVWSNIWSGVISWAIASAILAAGLLILKSGEMMPAQLPVMQYVYLDVALLALAIIICGLSAALAVNRYLHKDYSALFK